MCAKKEPRELLQPIADLDGELENLHHLVLEGTRPYGSAWVGGIAYFGFLEAI